MNGSQSTECLLPGPISALLAFYAMDSRLGLPVLAHVLGLTTHPDIASTLDPRSFNFGRYCFQVSVFRERFHTEVF